MYKIAILFLVILLGCSQKKIPKLIHTPTGIDSIQNWETLKRRQAFQPNKIAFCFISYDKECPLCKYYSSVIRKIADTFNTKGIQFVLLHLTEFKDSNNLWDSKTIQKLWDKEKVFINILDMTVTPEVVLVGKNGEIIYRGKIDDRAMDSNRHKLNAISFYLKDVLWDICNGKKGKHIYTKASGCYIEKP